jgi:hypothetical protein
LFVQLIVCPAEAVAVSGSKEITPLLLLMATAVPSDPVSAGWIEQW